MDLKNHMNDVDEDADKVEFVSITRALRYALTALVLGISYPNVRLALGISTFQRVYRDMLGNHPLPPETAFIIQARAILIVLSLVLPMLVVLSLFFRRRSLSIYVIALVIIPIFVQMFFTWQAVVSPFYMIVQGMEGNH